MKGLTPVRMLVPVLAALTSVAPMSAFAQAKANHWDVPRLAAEIEREGLTFSVGENWVTRYLAEGGDMKNITGLERPLDWESRGTFRSFDEEEVSMPQDFDWRRLLGNGLQPIRNQGGCGSCWAFAVTAVLEAIHMLKYGHSDLDLAEQTLVSSCERRGSCSGGYFDAFDYLQSPGLPDESSDPYVGRNTSCKSNLSSKAKVVRWGYVGAPGREPTTAEMKAAIYRYGPIAVDVNASFGAYSRGVYNRCNTGGTDHMVTIEGWDDRDQVWIMRNSWGTDWGENGYMRIKYTDAQGRKCNGIGRVAAYAEL